MAVQCCVWICIPLGCIKMYGLNKTLQTLIHNTVFKYIGLNSFEVGFENEAPFTYFKLGN